MELFPIKGRYIKKFLIFTGLNRTDCPYRPNAISGTVFIEHIGATADAVLENGRWKECSSAGWRGDETAG